MGSGGQLNVPSECFSSPVNVTVPEIVASSPDLFALIGKTALQPTNSSPMAAIFLPPAQKMPCLQMEGTPQSGHVQ